MLVTNREGKGLFHSRVSSLLNCLLPSMIEQASRNPYPIIARGAFFVGSPPASSSSGLSSVAPSDQERLRSIKRKVKKGVSGSLETLDVGSTPAQNSSQRIKSSVNPQLASEGKGKSGGDKLMKRSVSNEAGLAAATASTGFRLPSVVLVLPVQEKVAEEGAVQWDFDLLTEEEVRVS